MSKFAKNKSKLDFYLYGIITFESKFKTLKSTIWFSNSNLYTNSLILFSSWLYDISRILFKS